MEHLDKNYFDGGLPSILGSAILILVGLTIVFAIIFLLLKKRKMLPILLAVLTFIIGAGMAFMSLIPALYDATGAKLPGLDEKGEGTDWQLLLQGRLWIYVGLAVLWVLLFVLLIMIKSNSDEEEPAVAPQVQYDENGNPLPQAVYAQGMYQGYQDPAYAMQGGYLAQGAEYQELEQGAYPQEYDPNAYDPNEAQGYYDEQGNWIDTTQYADPNGAINPAWDTSQGYYQKPISYDNTNQYAYGYQAPIAQMTDGVEQELARAQNELNSIEQIQIDIDRKKKEIATATLQKAQEEKEKAQAEQERITKEIAQAEAELVRVEVEKARQEALKQEQEKLVNEIARLEIENATLQAEKAKEAELRAKTVATRPSLLDRTATKTTTNSLSSRTSAKSTTTAGSSLKDRVEQMRREREDSTTKSTLASRTTNASKPSALSSLANRTSATASATKVATSTTKPTTSSTSTSLKDKMEAMRKERENKTAGTTTAKPTTTSTTKTATTTSGATSLKDKMEALKKEREAKASTSSNVDSSKKVAFKRDENGKLVVAKDNTKQE